MAKSADTKTRIITSRQVSDRFAGDVVPANHHPRTDAIPRSQSGPQDAAFSAIRNGIRISWIVAAVFAAVTFEARLSAQTKDDIIPGAVRLKNGVILRGLCSSGHSLSAATLADSRLDLRKIDQGYRVYYVAVPQSEPIVPDNLVIPDKSYKIFQRATSYQPLNYSIGLHKREPFSTDGKSKVTLQLGGGQTLEINVGISEIDRRFAKVRGLNLRWDFGVSTRSIPDATYYPGGGQPGLLNAVKGFEKGETRLNMVQMLLEAEKFMAAQRLLEDTTREFPDLADRCERLSEKWDEFVADSALRELEQLKESGRFELARNLARKWPDAKLDAVIRVRASQFLQGIEEERKRVETIDRSLDMVLSQIEDTATRRQAMQMCSELRKELNIHTLPRFEAYEFLWQDENEAPEAKVALAATGWILGAKDAISDLSDAYGLFQVRFLVRDYLSSADTDTNLRNQIIQQLRIQEGFSIERVGLLLQNLPPVSPLPLSGDVANVPTQFEIPASGDVPRCMGLVPPEYSPSRKYPLLIAFSRGGGLTQTTLGWWAQQAQRHGYIVVVPEIYPPTEGLYDATAAQHQQMINLIRQLKAGLAIDDDRVFLTGHGIGAEAAMDLATAHPDMFAGVAPISGLGRKHFQWSATNSVNLPWYIISGTRQPFYTSRMMPVIRKLFTRVPVRGRAPYCNAMLVTYPERGFESYAEEIPDLFAWMDVQRRPVFTDRIEATTFRSTDRSWYWLELTDIPERFVSLDDPGTPEDRPEREGRIEAEINGNLIRIKTMPGDGVLRLSQDVPEIDLGEPIRVSKGGRVQRVIYEPSLRDLLDDFRERRDLKRLCYMKVLLN